MTNAYELPYLTRDFRPIPCLYKQRHEDFRVEELPLYPQSGAGTHVFVHIEKRGLGTTEAIRLLARQLDRDPRDFGYAGQKDAQGITTQWLSVEHIDESLLLGLELGRAQEGSLRVLALGRHGNKLKLGHLAGNRFRLRLRGLPKERLGELKALLEQLVARGVPNYFGEQRFGARGDGGLIGRALLEGAWREAATLIAGSPSAFDHGPVRKAREHYEKGEFAKAAKSWPGSFRDPIRICRVMDKSGDARRAVETLDRGLLRFYVSAWQSQLFNEVLAQRIDSIDRVRLGDRAWKHDNESIFLVEDEAAEAPRAAAFEISPTGPLYGGRMSLPGGAQAQLEDEVLTAANFPRVNFETKGQLEPAGGRRPLRFALDELQVETREDSAGPCVELVFRLASGCYATAVLREIGKGDLAR